MHGFPSGTGINPPIMVKLFQIYVEVNRMTSSTPNYTPILTSQAKNTWMPTTAGILNIITGFIAVPLVTLFIIPSFLPSLFSGEEGFVLSIVSFYLLPVMIIIGVPSIIISIVGGVFCLKRRRFGWALAGAICSIILLLVPGLVSIILTVQSINEFKKKVV